MKNDEQIQNLDRQTKKRGQLDKLQILATKTNTRQTGT